MAIPNTGRTNHPVNVLIQITVDIIRAAPNIVRPVRVERSDREEIINNEPAIAGPSGPLAAI